MRCTFLLLLLLLLPGLTAFRSLENRNAHDLTRLAEAQSIISSLPDITAIWRLAQAASNNNHSHQERETEWKKIESFRASFRRLHALIQRGDHMSDFPGLLALGLINWEKDRRLYELHCGLFDVPIASRSTPPWYSRAWIRFDATGRVWEIKPYVENW